MSERKNKNKKRSRSIPNIEQGKKDALEVNKMQRRRKIRWLRDATKLRVRLWITDKQKTKLYTSV